MIISSVNATLSVTTSLFRRSNNSLRSLTFCLPFSSSAAFVSSTDKRSRKKWSQPVFAALEVGGVKITKQDVVKDGDPTNNVPDNIFSKLGMQLHRRDQHPLGIIKNAIYDYFDTNYSNKFNKFDDLCPIVSLKQLFNFS
ncbi:phenylalanyl-tRNA ligase chloroplastic/mitochondrial-like [Trifolium pratense]|uniref:Phenylalanyl-tRNA ligase chloroplastic/mitochondrial-like n=1 Tax=Trifolium pratense TaxID=57577 RepID=A0A2K3LGW2_TRIPR|nr:phenylalanyl-tRNA ligase chloroplastic/mitochondrial-like [Trifolium pratense]